MLLAAGRPPNLVEGRAPEIAPGLEQLEARTRQKIRHLRRGELSVTKAHVAFWRRHAPATRLINEYGPTETVVGCSVYKIDPDTRVAHAVPIGKPIANMRCHVLDAYLNPVPIGVVGELYVGGPGVARGYLNLPDLTAERFIHDPFDRDPHARLYKTGDLARYLADGNLEFLGRRDLQVKVRGFRIELGEVEAVLRLHPGIRDAAVRLGRPPREEDRLIAYVVPRDAGAVGSAMVDKLRAMLRLRLPDYMMPARFVVLSELPLTSRGKLDYSALSVPEADSPASNPYVAPRNAVERIVSRMFEDVLGVPTVAVHSDFFADLGGHSLLATALVSRIREVFNVQLPLQRIFESPTVAQLAELLLADEQDRSTITRTAEVWLEMIEADEGAAVTDNDDRELFGTAGRTP